MGALCTVTAREHRVKQVQGATSAQVRAPAGCVLLNESSANQRHVEWVDGAISAKIASWRGDSEQRLRFDLGDCGQIALGAEEASFLGSDSMLLLRGAWAV